MEISDENRFDRANMNSSVTISKQQQRVAHHRLLEDGDFILLRDHNIKLSRKPSF